MSPARSDEYLESLVREFQKLPKETPWLEFKHNNSDPQQIGEYISALANTAALCGKANAYLVWGVEDSTHQLCGTEFSPSATKIGNEELESWILRTLSPKIHFTFYELMIEGKHVVVLEIARAFRHPVQFQGNEFVRVGTYKKRLREFPEKQRELWRIFDEVPFESQIAADELSDDQVVTLLDYPAYFHLLHLPLPSDRQSILAGMESDAVISQALNGKWEITNLGAILFGRKLEEFPALKRKAVRVISYRGTQRVETLRERKGSKGYAISFEGLIGYINGLLPSNEVIGKALRRSVPMYPELAIRELVANALIHQDFSITGSGPMIEIFDDRLEITNPGAPLVETERLLDTPPRSRNEALASVMRRIGVCEERGSGIDKVVWQTEYYQLPAPYFEIAGENMTAALFAHKPLSKMAKTDRVRACYLHACLRFVGRDHMTNTSLRERFGIAVQNSALASRLIKEAVEAKYIRPYDEAAGRKYMRYVPFWA
ncbi:MAG TPA: ATP-binding protein [Bryobacteraceae bacterium]|nr:ATP-binding protein [Bryobacteraceae bacterium]